MPKNRYDAIRALQSIGVTRDDATALRRISMTLHRWHERECGDSNDYCSVCLVRGYKQPDGTFMYDDTGLPFEEVHSHRGSAKPSYRQVLDRERGALKSLGEIMSRYPTLTPYVQADPRGCALYVLRPEDVPEGKAASVYYSRGIAVY